EMPFLVIYTPPNPTSPEYVTVPIANKGIPTMVYETYMYDSVSQKASYASALINALDTKVADPNKNYDLTITAVPKGGNYYAPQNVTLTANQTSTIYYSTDGNIPTKNSTIYSGSINITNSTVLKFFAIDSDGKYSQIFTENYFMYAWTPYTYQVTVSYKLSNKKYRIKYTVPYTAKKRIRTKIGNKWKYSYIYVTKYKTKYKWDYKYGYRIETRSGYRWQLI
ncbi:MAG TPA: chitobiase/beta-hexosaminidase C-terminal domain-containing protein, partial [Methanobacterium sp.]|nr:chitobiase/beta-hexosaminidase C-terminal domain-containing protein [Methanobacterium sp.]